MRQSSQTSTKFMNTSRNYEYDPVTLEHLAARVKHIPEGVINRCAISVEGLMGPPRVVTGTEEAYIFGVGTSEPSTSEKSSLNPTGSLQKWNQMNGAW